MDKIKVSDIRAKFPMYADLSDDDLLIGIRKKYYSDIPMKQFVARIDYDTDRQKYDPTSSMSGLQKFAAGYGKAGADIARGLGQWVGAVDREDVAESRRLDAPLMNTGAGMAGSLTGNLAAMAPAALLPGANALGGAAAYGAVTGALAPSADSGETLKNVAVGGALGPAAILAGRGLGALYQFGKGAIEPLTKKGQERMAATVLQQFAKDPTRAAANLRTAKPLVPGSIPTLAQAADDPGLAQLERTLVNNPETGPMLSARFADQRAARLATVRDIGGTDDYYNAIKEGRSIFAKEDYAKALTQGIDPDMAKSLDPQIKSLLGRPSIKEAQNRAIALARESDIDLSDFSSPQGLHWLKTGLDDIISGASSPGSSVGKQRLRALMQTKDDLMNVIEDLVPGYREANDNFAAMSRQVNSMDVARDLQRRMEPALARFGANTRETGSAYAQALEAAGESVKKQTGMKLPLRDVMNTRDLDSLQNVAKDFARKAKTEDMGRAVGSNTMQNLAAQNLLRRTLGPTGLPQSWSENTALQTVLSPMTGLYRLGGAEKRVMDRLLDAAMDPQDAAGLLMLARSPGLLEKFGRRAERFLPLPGNVGLLSGGLVPAEQ